MDPTASEIRNHFLAEENGLKTLPPLNEANTVSYEIRDVKDLTVATINNLRISAGTEKFNESLWNALLYVSDNNQFMTVINRIDLLHNNSN